MSGAYGWIVQDSYELPPLEDEPLFPERVLLDRVSVWWHRQSASRRQHRSAYGPALVELPEAVSWIERETDRTVVRMDDHDYSLGGAADGRPPWRDWPDKTVPVLSLGAPTQWRASWCLGLNAQDHAASAGGFAARLDDLVHVQDVKVRIGLQELHATFTVEAPNRELALHVSRFAGLQAATAVPNGLTDVLNGRLLVEVE